MSGATFSGTFLDIVHPNARDGVYWNRRTIGFESTDWHALVGHLHRDFRIRQLILMNVCAPHGAFLFPCRSLRGAGWEPRFPTGCEDPVGAILEAADAYGMQVFLGLGVDPDTDTTGITPEATDEKLEWHSRLASALIDRYGKLRSFHGIYVVAEPRFEATGLLPDSQVGWLGALSAALRPAIDSRPLLACPFHHWKIEAANPDPAQLAAQMKATGMDIICPQDGVGFSTTRDLRPASRSAAAGATLAAACRDAGRTFWYIIETFCFENEVLFQPLLPAKWSRIRDQLECGASISDTLIAYQIPGLMTSQQVFQKLGDSNTDLLYEAYQSHLQTRNGSTS